MARGDPAGTSLPVLEELLITVEADVVSSCRLTLQRLILSGVGICEVGGRQLHELCRSRAWEISSSADEMRDSSGEEGTRASLPESSGLRSRTVVLHIIPPFVPERVSDSGSIDIPLSSEGENPAGSVVPRPPHCLLLIFTLSWPYFTRVTRTLWF